MAKKIFSVLAIFSTALLTACQSPQSNILNFTTPAPVATFNIQNQTAVVNVHTQDFRASREVAAYTKNGETVRLISSPEVVQLFQQAMLQDLNAKGFQISPTGANAQVAVGIKQFFATVKQGNFRHKANAEISIDVSVIGTKGTFNKTFNANRGYEGVLSADNETIKKILDNAYQDVIRAIYHDNEVANAIHQYK